MASRTSAVLLLVFLVACPVAVASAPSAAADAGPAAQSTPAQPPVSENTTFHIQIQPNGDARWTITDTYALEDANETRAFEEFGTEYVNGNTDVGYEQPFRDANDAASAATGREMELTNVSRDYVVDERTGEIILQFTWTNFATTNQSRLVVRDGFNTTEGTWFPRLHEDQTIVISPPAGYEVTNSPPTSYLDDRDLRLEGPQVFEPGYLEVVYQEDETLGNTPPGPAGGDLPLWPGVALLFIIGLIAAVIYIDRQDGSGFPPVGGNETDSGGDDGPPMTPASDSSETTNGDIDVALLSDEERVERLLEQNGGRMKQARIVKETGWSNAKVSQLLSSMDEDGRIDKLRIGRENLISFPDEDVTEIED